MFTHESESASTVSLKLKDFSKSWSVTYTVNVVVSRKPETVHIVSFYFSLTALVRLVSQCLQASPSVEFCIRHRRTAINMCATSAVSFEILAVEVFPVVKMTLKGHSRSSPMSPFSRTHVMRCPIFYGIIFEI